MDVDGLFKQKLLVPASLVHSGGLFPSDGVLVLVHVQYSATAKVAVVPSLHAFWCSFSFVLSLLTVSLM